MVTPVKLCFDADGTFCFRAFYRLFKRQVFLFEPMEAYFPFWASTGLRRSQNGPVTAPQECRDVAWLHPETINLLGPFVATGCDCDGLMLWGKCAVSIKPAMFWWRPESFVAFRQPSLETPHQLSIALPCPLGS